MVSEFLKADVPYIEVLSSSYPFKTSLLTIDNSIIYLWRENDKEKRKVIFVFLVVLRLIFVKPIVKIAIIHSCFDMIFIADEDCTEVP